MPPSAPPSVTPPHTLVIDGFVIETYPSIAHTPFATTPPPPPPTPPALPECLICYRLPNPQHPTLPCSNCPRIYHAACLESLLRPLIPTPRPFLCPPCIQTTNHLHHRRATAVASLRRFHHHLAAFPSLPPKLSLKALNLHPPLVQTISVPATPLPPLPIRLRNPATLPPKRRLRSMYHSLEPSTQSNTVACRSHTLFKKVSPASLSRRRHTIASIGADIARVLENRPDDRPELINQLLCVNQHLAQACAVRVDDVYIKVADAPQPAQPDPAPMDVDQPKDAASDAKNCAML